MPGGWTQNHDRGRGESSSATFFSGDLFRVRIPSHPFLFSRRHEDTRSFPTPKSSCHVNASRSFGFFVRSLVWTLRLLPSFKRMHVLRERVLWCGFVDLSLSFPFGKLPLRSFRSPRARHELRLTARTDPLADALLRSSRKNPIVQVSTVAIFFSRVLRVARFRAGVAVLHGSARCTTVRVALPPHVLVVPPQRDAGSRACARVRATKRRLQASGRPMPPFWDPTLHVRPTRSLCRPLPDLRKGGIWHPGEKTHAG